MFFLTLLTSFYSPPNANVLLWVITSFTWGFPPDLPGPSMVDSLRSHVLFILVDSHVRTSPPSQTVNARVTDLSCSFYCSLASPSSLSLFAFFCPSMSLSFNTTYRPTPPPSRSIYCRYIFCFLISPDDLPPSLSYTSLLLFHPLYLLFTSPTFLLP